MGCYHDSVHMKAISDGLRKELEAIALAKGIDLTKAGSASVHGSPVPPFKCLFNVTGSGCPGRHMELDSFPAR